MTGLIQFHRLLQEPGAVATAGLTAAVLVVVCVLFMGRGRPSKRWHGRHVVITGGSEGIGFAVAHELLLRGASVSLLARTQAKLDSAAARLRGLGSAHTVTTFSVDVTDYAKVTEVIATINKDVGRIDVLVCCAGTSVPGRFLEQGVSVFQETMALNYFGAVHAVKAVLPDMVARRAGHVVLVASAAAVCGIVGLSSYCPTKYAVRGLADSLRNEGGSASRPVLAARWGCPVQLLASDVRVSIGYPPDTDTPGYAEEQRSKPPECHAASRAAGDVLYQPEQVARCLVGGIEAGAYHLPSPDFGHNVMVAASAGLTPRRYPLALECLLAPLVVVALRVFGWVVDSAVVKAAKSRA